LPKIAKAVFDSDRRFLSEKATLSSQLKNGFDFGSKAIVDE
jgi:hypothetical protein